VSQVLPIIALCLLAPPNTLVVLKEPELHLNPSLQRALADFFVVMVQSGRQILVETHSEYLITRLRLLSAKDKEVRKLFSLVFTHQEMDSQSGLLNSKYESVFPDSKGQLPDWPDGFFDQIPQDIQELLGVMLDEKDQD
jgi:predicted ATPase